MTSPVTVPPVTTSFRDMSDALSPTWLNAYWTSRWRYCQSILWDALEVSAAYSIYCGLPSTAPPDALPWLSADRQVFRGPGETQAHFVQRLAQWLELARYAGTNTGIMISILGYLSPLEPKISCVDNSGTWWTYAANVDPFPPTQTLPTAPVRVVASPSNWHWDGSSDPFIGSRGWWRTWVIIESISGSPWPAPTATFGGGARFGDGTAYNWVGSQADAQTIRNTVQQRKSAHTYVPTIVITYSTAIFQSGGTAGVDLPDGHWGHWSKVAASGGYPSVYVSARNLPNASYADGVA